MLGKCTATRKNHNNKLTFPLVLAMRSAIAPSELRWE